jgi:hypothetical protein
MAQGIGSTAPPMPPRIEMKPDGVRRFTHHERR